MSVSVYSKKKEGNTSLSTNFKVTEFACNDGSDAIFIDSDNVDILQSIRNLTGKAIHITSGYRTKSYNTKVGGVSNSYHVQGRAVDFYSDKCDEISLARICELLGAHGIGCYINQHFVHMDTRTYAYYWTQGNAVTSRNSFVSEQIVKGVQERLLYCYKKTRRKGYNCGEVDGILGAKTINAFIYFCNNNRTQRNRMLKVIRGW